MWEMGQFLLLPHYKIADNQSADISSALQTMRKALLG